MILKRSFDILGAALMLVILAPVFALLAVAIKLDTPGPVLYWQRRLGRDGKPFHMAKFRKMPVSLPSQGPLLTRRYDARLTRLGRLLERTKLDELPQLINVLRGEMSLVGPRPEVERFVDLADERWRTVLRVRPGIFGLTQLRFRNESERYPADLADLEAFYRERILPVKLISDAEYVRRAGLLTDVRLIVACIFVSLFGTLTLAGIRQRAPQALRLLLDTLIAVLATGLVLGATDALGEVSWSWLLLVGVVRLGTFALHGTHRRHPASVTTHDLVRLTSAVALGSLLLAACASLFMMPVPALALLFEALLLIMVLAAKGLCVAHMYTLRRSLDAQGRTSALRAATLVALASVASLATFSGMLALEQGVVLAQQSASSAASVLALVALLLCTGAIRAVGFAHAVLAGTKPVAVTWLGTALILAADALFATGALTVATLIVEAVLTLMLMILLARYALMRIRRETAAAEAEANVTGVLVVGLPPRLEALLAWMSEQSKRVRIRGLVATKANRARRGETIHDAEVLGEFEELPGLLDAKQVDALGYVESATSPQERNQLQTLAKQHNLPLIDLAPTQSEPTLVDASEPHLLGPQEPASHRNG